jgi:hypothetical protein
MLKAEKAKPQNNRLMTWLLKGPWFLPGFLILLNIYSLHLDMKPAPVTLYGVLRISCNVAGVVIALVLGFQLQYLRFTDRMLLAQRDLFEEIFEKLDKF